MHLHINPVPIVIINNELVIEESFIDFIKINENTGLRIATDILQKLEVDGLNFKN